MSTEQELFRRYFDFAALIKGGRLSVNWLEDGARFWYDDGAGDATVVLVDPRAATSERVDRAAVEPVGDGANGLSPRVIRKGLMEGLPDVVEVPSPDGRWAAGIQDHDIWLRSSVDGRLLRLTGGGTEARPWDLAGACWSPDGVRLAVQRVDFARVTRLPIVHWLKPVEEVEWVPYPRVGGHIPQQEVVILDTLSHHVLPLAARETWDQSFAILGWLPDGSELLLLRQNLEMNRVSVLAAAVATGACREVVTETSETFISMSRIWGGMPFVLPSGDGIIIRSERDGWAHLYLYAIDGTLRARLTHGDFPVLDVVAVDEDEGWVYFTAHAEERLYDTHLYRVDLQGTSMTRLTEAVGHHDVEMAPSKQFFVDAHSTVATPPLVELRRADGTRVQVLSEGDVSRTSELGWRPPEEFTATADDGQTELRGVLYLPQGFDPARRYPVIDNIYGGPQMTWVPRRFWQDSGLSSQALAQLGFAVVHIDARGTPERSKRFHDVVFRNWGRNEIPDHVAALRDLGRERPYLDLDRVGVYGGSWGGYMAIRAMVLAPDFFRAAVAMYPNVDLEDHDSGVEAYMGMPQDNKAAYDYASSLRMVDRIRGPILLVHGTSDTNVTFSCTMKMVDAMTRAMKRYELIVLPEQTHVLRGVGRDYFLRALCEFFVRHLGPAGAG